ncbi:predicted protein [Naegleria gruberi]|uniref:Predicted protein n=1 Tax=Naegleria gruberi TaxID=5762 RepID=D2W102_NAEGR|nr:uncharacterized protein NAEGRDRAFT_75041 [Naegleria gruberi]EFC37271.1 predicted protein [Naegleria gruberi]|eukprot:XP_002670015.1 predicted protein [Naegleria gruberi strain NEG-M]
MAKGLTLLFHFVAISSQLAAFYWMHLIGILSLSMILKMFTLWTGCVQVIYFGLSLLEGLFGGNTKNQRSSNSILNDLFHLTLLMALATVSLFWSIYWLDPENMVPKGMYYPDGLNHLHHTVPGILVLIELILVRSTSDVLHGIWKRKFYMVLCIPVAYLSFTGLSKHMKGYWPYPFMASWSFLEFGIFCVFAVILASILHYLIYLLIKLLKKPETVSLKSE